MRTRRQFAMLALAGLLATACTSAPTSPAVDPLVDGPRLDGGFTMGSGSYTGSEDDSETEGVLNTQGTEMSTTSSDSTDRGFTMGSGS